MVCQWCWFLDRPTRGARISPCLTGYLARSERSPCRSAATASPTSRRRDTALSDFAGDVVALLDALGIERAVLAGHSGSCLVVRRAALDHPDRVAGLVMEASPTTLANNANLIHFVESIVANLIDPIDPEFARSFVTDTSSENLPPELVEVLVDDMLSVPARVWKETFAGLLEYDDVAELSNIEVPTLLVWGNADALVSRAMQDQLASTIPNAELAVYDGIGHTPRWEQPARFKEDVTRFVRHVFERS